MPRSNGLSRAIFLCIPFFRSFFSICKASSHTSLSFVLRKSSWSSCDTDKANRSNASRSVELACTEEDADDGAIAIGPCGEGAGALCTESGAEAVGSIAT